MECTAQKSSNVLVDRKSGLIKSSTTRVHNAVFVRSDVGIISSGILLVMAIWGIMLLYRTIESWILLIDIVLLSFEYKIFISVDIEILSPPIQNAVSKN